MDNNSENLRAQAKEELRQGKIIDTSLYETDMKVLVEELSIYQIELEHQNQELMLSQDHLQQSNNRYLDLFDNAPVGYLIVDSTGIIKDINQTACVLLENSKTQFVDTKISKLIHPDYQDIYFLYFRSLIYQKNNQPCDIKLRKANNSFFYGRIQGVCQTSEIDSDPEFRLAISDISTQKEMEFKLLAAKEQTEQSEMQHRTILQTAMDGYWLVDLDGKFLEVNDAYCSMSGYTKTELLKMHISDFEVIEDVEKTEYHIKKVIVNGSDRFESKHRRKDGSVYDVEISTIYQNEYKNAFVVFIRDISEQKLAENALLEAEWKFKALFDLGPIGVAYHRMIYDEAGKPIDYYFVDANASYNELTGVNPKGMTVRQAFPGIENDPFDWIGKFGHVAKTGETIRFEQFLESNQRWYDCVGYQYKPDHFVAAFSEITKRKEAEIALKESELRFKVLFDNAPDAMFLADPASGRIVDANNAASILFKKQKQELVGLFQYELHPPQNTDISKSTFKTQFEEKNETGKNIPVENSILCSDGTEIPVEIVGQAIQIGDKSLMLGTFRNITERKKAEDALRESEEKFRSFFENSVVGKSITTIEGNLSVNNSFCKIVGYSEAELNTLNWKEITHADDIELNFNILSSILKGEKQSERWEKRYIHKDGHIVWVDISTTLHRDGNGNPLYFITAIFDITERKQAELLLENERALYLDLVNTQPAGIYRIRVFPKTSWEVDAWTKADTPPYKMELISDRFCEILEIDPQIFESHPGILVDLVHPDDKEEFVRRNEEANTLVNVFSWDCRLVINNNIKWIHFESLPRKLENGDILFTGIIYDITEHKHAQVALSKSEERYSSLLQYLETGIVVHAPDSAILTSNPRASELLGLTFEQMQGKVAIDPNWNFVNIDNIKLLVENYPVQQIISTKKAIKDQIFGIQKTANHTIIWVNVNGFPVLDNNGEITEIVISFNDITNSKIAEDSLKNNQKLLSETEKIGNVGGWEYYYDSGILNWTEETYNIHELQYDKNLSLDAGINYYTPEAIPIINNAVQQAIEFSIPFDLELEIITAKGNKRSVHSICKIDSEHKRIFGFFQDITERKKAEEQISIQLNELRRWYEVTLDREGRVMELKREVNELLKMHGEALRYGSTTEGNSETISNV